MRILVTGGGGFLGTYIIQELLKNPTHMVTSFSRHTYSHLEDIGVPTIKGDLTKKEDVEHALSQGFDAIFHVAALAGVWGKYETFYNINFVGTQNLVELAQKYNIRKFIYTSTPSVVFGSDDLLGVDESTPYPEKHLTAYAETKTLAEKLVLESNSENFMTVAIRPHLIWGPGDPHLFPRVIQKGREGKLRIVGDGDNIVDIVYVENAALAHVQAFENLREGSPVCGQAYFVGQERPVNLWDFINQVLGFVKVEAVAAQISTQSAYRLGWLLEKIWKFLGIQRPEPPMTRFVALNLGKSHYFSHEKAKRDFGYTPRVSIEEGLRRTFSSRQQGFTLVELMVVVAIIGLLSAVAIPNFKKYQARAKTAEAKLQLSAIYTSEQSFFADYSIYSNCLRYMGFNPTAEVSSRYYMVGFPGLTASIYAGAYATAVNSGISTDALASGGCPRTGASTQDFSWFPAGKSIGTFVITTTGNDHATPDVTLNLSSTKLGNFSAAAAPGLGDQDDNSSFTFRAIATGYIDADGTQQNSSNGTSGSSVFSITQDKMIFNPRSGF